jgi:hypothetical protein
MTYGISSGDRSPRSAVEEIESVYREREKDVDPEERATALGHIYSPLQPQTDYNRVIDGTYREQEKNVDPEERAATREHIYSSLETDGPSSLAFRDIPLEEVTDSNRVKESNQQLSETESNGEPLTLAQKVRDCLSSWCCCSSKDKID